jgi:multidrug efflux pump subunit AcrA (membrane-fusion protein)
MAYEKAVIALDKKRRDYLLQQNKMKMHVMRLERRVKELSDLISRYQTAIRATRVTTPGDGIVMLAKKWDGTKYSKDDEINIWRPLLATLPDMSTVISETYVKEIDVTKVNVGDSVSISIDALPDKKYTGKVTYVAPIGEDHQGFDMKVFRVVIQFDKGNGDLKPGMTCTNHIIIHHYMDQPIIPEDYVYAENGNKVVYVKRNGEMVSQPVQLGAGAKNMVVVLQGLSEGDRIYHKHQEDS